MIVQGREREREDNLLCSGQRDKGDQSRLFRVEKDGR